MPRHRKNSRTRRLVWLFVNATAIALVAVAVATTLRPTSASAAELAAKLTDGHWIVQDEDLQRTLEFVDPGNVLPEVNPETAEDDLRKAVLWTTGGIDLGVDSDRDDLEADLFRARDILTTYHEYLMTKGGSGGASTDLSTIAGQAKVMDDALEFVTQKSADCRARCLIPMAQRAYRYLMLPVFIGSMVALATLILEGSTIPIIMIGVAGVVVAGIANFMWEMKKEIDAQVARNRNREIQQQMGRVIGGMAVTIAELQNQANQANLGGVGGAMDRNEEFLEARTEEMLADPAIGEEAPLRHSIESLQRVDWNEP